MKKNIDEIKKITETLAEKINAPKGLLPSFGGLLKETEIVLDENGHLYFVTHGDKGGTEYHICLDEDDLLHKVFCGITLGMAYSLPKPKDIEQLEFRKWLFIKQEELLGRLNLEWMKKLQKYNAGLLKYR